MAALTFEELKKRQGSQLVTTPQRFERKSFARKAGEFLAPTTTGLLTGEKELTVRTGLGAALEIGSFVVPAGAILRGAGLVGRGARAITLGTRAARTAKAAKVTRAARITAKTEGLTFEALRSRAGQVGIRLRGQARTAALVGGVSGAGFGAGRALGEEELGLREVAGQAAITGLAGVVGGAVLAPVISITSMGIKGIVGLTSKGIRTTTKNLRPQSRQAAIDSLTDAFDNSFVVDKAAVNNKLDLLMVKARRFGGPDTNRGLLKELAEEGYMPTVEGKLANMRPVIDNLRTRIGKRANELDEFLKPVKQKTNINTFQKRVNKTLSEDFGIDLDKTTRQSNSIFKSLRNKHGKDMTAVEINALRKKLNAKTGAFKKEAFVDDAANAIARATRERLNELAPTTIVRGINDEIARFIRIQNTAKIFHNKTIDAGFVSSATGRFLGVIGGAGVGLSVAGPGGLVVAGVLAQVGSKIIAQMVRRSRFNPQLVQIIRQGVSRDQKFMQKLIKDATGADKALLRKIFGVSKKPSVTNLGKR